ncbi:hypothetical protein HDU98_002699 [Podochytrium sp. JEL0797]|nr:hypothetical protein HDU98_002699 [Podochytrium sp. JEL0797]
MIAAKGGILVKSTELVLFTTKYVIPSPIHSMMERASSMVLGESVKSKLQESGKIEGSEKITGLDEIAVQESTDPSTDVCTSEGGMTSLEPVPMEIRYHGKRDLDASIHANPPFRDTLGAENGDDHKCD